MEKKIKCVLVGDQSVGKSSLMHSFFQNKIAKSYSPTILELMINLWDTCGDKTKFQDFLGLVQEGVNIYFICFSLIDRQSLRNAINFWYADQLAGVKNQLNQENKEVVFIGCQLDLKDQYLEDKKSNLVVHDPEDIFEQMGVQYYSVSAVTQENLQHCFNSVFFHYYNKINKVIPQHQLSKHDTIQQHQPSPHLKDNKSKCYIF